MQILENTNKEKPVIILDCDTHSNQLADPILYEIAFKLCPVPLIVIKDSVILDCNSSAARLMDGGDIQSIIGKNILDFISPDMHEIAQSR
ncbi:MAG: PAS domain-containing protein, partial [Thermodesulfovibrionales bacterium]|nr:PAS domain-containing protein [Thermodesulfovibrionales bacterium]